MTGGLGYIGRFCVRSLRDAGWDVVAVDRRPPEAGPALETPTITADVADSDRIEAVLRAHHVDVVLHLAGDKSVAESMTRPGPLLRNNVGGALGLLEAMVAAGVKRLVFSSSAAVYGTPERLPIDEAAPLRPENPYGASKAMIEDTLRWYAACHQVDSLSLRYFNAAGAATDGSLGEDPGRAVNLVPRVMDALAGRSGPLQVFGTDFPTPDGTAIRDYVHVEDIAAGHLRAIEHVLRTRGADAINIGTGRGWSVREVLAAAGAATGRPVPFEEAPRRRGDPAAVWADTAKAVQVLGWSAARSLDDIMRTAWEWEMRGARPA